MRFLPTLVIFSAVSLVVIASLAAEDRQATSKPATQPVAQNVQKAIQERRPCAGMTVDQLGAFAYINPKPVEENLETYLTYCGVSTDGEPAVFWYIRVRKTDEVIVTVREMEQVQAKPWR